MTQRSSSHVRAFLLISFGAVCISFAPVFVKLIGTSRIGPTAIGFWRLLFGAGMLFSFALFQKKKVSLTRAEYGWAALSGFLFSLDMFFWIRAIFYCGGGMATILSNTQVFASAVLSYFVFRERLSLKFYLAAMSAFVGVGLLVGIGSADVQFTHNYVLGIIFGLISGLSYANYIIALKKGSHSPDLGAIITLMAWASAFCALFLGISMLIEKAPMFPPDARTWLLLIGFGFVAQFAGWLAISSSLPKLDASRAGLALLLQPTLATVWGVMMFGEHLTVVQMLGAAITLTAIYFGSVRR